MTDLADGAVDLGGPVFEYDLEILQEVGVRLAPVQEMLLKNALEYPGEEFLAIRPAVLTSPTGYRFRMEPLEFSSDGQDIEYLWYPSPVIVKWDMAYDEKQHFDTYEKGWRRFPSLPCHMSETSMWDGEIEWLDWEAVRIWDLWPLEHVGQVDLICQAVSEVLQDEEGWMRYCEWLAVDRGEVDLCEYAEANGGGMPENHEHRSWEGKLMTPEECDINGYECATGLQMHLAAFEEMTVVGDTPDGGEHPDRFLRPWEPLKLPQAYQQEIWEPLLRSSRRNTHAALNAFPPWDRDDVLRAERVYSPWLWSS